MNIEARSSASLFDVGVGGCWCWGVLVGVVAAVPALFARDLVDGGGGDTIETQA